MQAFELVHKVLERFRGLPVKLSGITGKTQHWYRSHGEEPKNQNPLAWGNISEVEHYMRYVRLYETERGAGKYLNSLVYQELAAEFAEESEACTSQNDIHTEILDEGCDVHRWLLKFSLDDANIAEHRKFQDECDEAIAAIAKAKATSKLVADRKSLRDHAKAAVANKNGNGRK